MSQVSHRVLMIGWEYPPHNSGGLGVATEGMTRALAGQNTQIYLTLPYQTTIDASHLQVLSCFSPDWHTPGKPPFSSYASAMIPEDTQADAKKTIAAFDLRALPASKMEQKVDDYAKLVDHDGQKLASQYDVIHAHDWMSFPAAIKLKQSTGKPMIAHIHSTEYDRIPSGNGSPYIMRSEYEGMMRSDMVVAVSYYTKQLLVDKYHINPNKIEVIHNGIFPAEHIDSNKSAFAPRRPLVVFMGRLTSQKGTEYFLKMARAVHAKIPDVLFMIAGSGDLYHELLFKTADTKLTATVLFSGFLRDAQRNRLLDRADVFVMPSLSEPFGLVALEAAQRHTPVIVSRNTGVAEVMPSAISVDFWDIEAMTNQVVQLISQPKYAHGVIDRQLEEVQRVTWHSAANKIKSVYSKLFGRR